MPPPRRKACDPEQPTVIPRDPDRDLALADREQKILKAILSLTADDPRLPGRRRWCCWARNETILAQLATMGQEKGHSYLDRGLGKLRGLRLESKTMTEFRQWLIEQAPRRGMPCEPPPLMRKRKGRVLIILAELPPVVSEAYGPLEIPPPQDSIDPLEVRCSEPRSEVPADLKVRCANRALDPMDSPEIESSSTTTREGGFESDPIRAKLLADIQADPRNNFLRLALRTYDNPPANSPRRPTTFVENVAAGRERTPAVPALALATVATIDPSAEGDDASAGRISPRESSAIAAAVRALPAGDLDQAERVGRRLVDAVGASHDPELVRTYGETLRLVASGQVSPEAVADVIRQVAKPTISNPRGFLRVEFAKLRAGKNPPPGLLAKVPPAAGRNQHNPASLDCTVAK